jgi:uncharacterized protein
MKLILLLLIPFCLFSSIAPWGKDSGLAYMPREERRAPLKRTIGDFLIEFHRNVISPADGPRSNFIPTSSLYTLTAMQKYGFFTGFFMGCDRLMRENKDPWVYRKQLNDKGQVMKWDPA